MVKTTIKWRWERPDDQILKCFRCGRNDLIAIAKYVIIGTSSEFLSKFSYLWSHFKYFKVTVKKIISGCNFYEWNLQNDKVLGTYKCVVVCGRSDVMTSSLSRAEVHSTTTASFSKRQVQFPASEHINAALKPRFEAIFSPLIPSPLFRGKNCPNVVQIAKVRAKTWLIPQSIIRLSLYTFHLSSGELKKSKLFLLTFFESTPNADLARFLALMIFGNFKGDLKNSRMVNFKSVRNKKLLIRLLGCFNKHDDCTWLRQCVLS